MKPEKPKLWDGANAMAEGKLRTAIATTNTPFLRVSGEGFHGYKKNMFHEITQEHPHEEPEESEVVIYSSVFNESYEYIYNEYVYTITLAIQLENDEIIGYRWIHPIDELHPIFMQHYDSAYLGYGVNAAIVGKNISATDYYKCYEVDLFTETAESRNKVTSRNISTIEEYYYKWQPYAEMPFHGRKFIPLLRGENSVIFAFFHVKTTLKANEAVFAQVAECIVYDSVKGKLYSTELEWPNDILSGAPCAFGTSARLPDGTVLAIVGAHPWSDGARVQDGRMFLFRSSDNCKSFSRTEIDLPDDMDKATVAISTGGVVLDDIFGLRFKPVEGDSPPDEWDGVSNNWGSDYAGARHAFVNTIWSTSISPCGDHSALITYSVVNHRHLYFDVEWNPPITELITIYDSDGNISGHRDPGRLHIFKALHYYEYDEKYSFNSHEYGATTRHAILPPMTSENLDKIKNCSQTRCLRYDSGILYSCALPRYPGQQTDWLIKSAGNSCIQLSKSEWLLVCPSCIPTGIYTGEKNGYIPSVEIVRARMLYTTDEGRTWNRWLFDGIFSNHDVGYPSAIQVDGKNAMIFMLRYMRSGINSYLSYNHEARAFIDKNFIYDDCSYLICVTDLLMVYIMPIFIGDTLRKNALVDFSSANYTGLSYVAVNYAGFRRLDCLKVDGVAYPLNGIKLPKA